MLQISLQEEIWKGKEEGHEDKEEEKVQEEEKMEDREEGIDWKGGAEKEKGNGDADRKILKTKNIKKERYNLYTSIFPCCITLCFLHVSTFL